MVQPPNHSAPAADQESLEESTSRLQEQLAKAGDPSSRTMEKTRVKWRSKDGEAMVNGGWTMVNDGLTMVHDGSNMVDYGKWWLNYG